MKNPVQTAAPTMKPVVMRDSLFREFCDIAYRRAGIRLKSGKESLVAARVAKRMRTLRIASPGEYLEFLRADESEDELVLFLNVITTNHTGFFREADHFEVLKREAGRWKRQGQRRFRFWSAACSSGEEIYTMALVLDEVLDEEDDWKILGTDLSTFMLDAARRAEYPAKCLDNVDPTTRKRFFDVRPRDGEIYYAVKPGIVSRLRFGRLNLSTPPFPLRGPLDAIFCRNVMIYFDQAVRARLVNELVRLLKPGGLLMVGHSEALAGLKSGLERTGHSSVYRKCE